MCDIPGTWYQAREYISAAGAVEIETYTTKHLVHETRQQSRLDPSKALVPADLVEGVEGVPVRAAVAVLVLTTNYLACVGGGGGGSDGSSGCAGRGALSQDQLAL